MLKISAIIRRNYTDASLQFELGKWHLTLDGKYVYSDGATALASENEALMQHVVQEWQNAGDVINIANMPQTRLTIAMLDMNDARLSNMQNHLMEYVSNEMLAMRDIDNGRNDDIYTPILQSVEALLGVKYELHTQLIAPAQPYILLEKVQKWLCTLPAKSLLIHYVLTQILGSFALSIAAMELQINPQIIMQAAWLEHDTQMQKWGLDVELLRKRNSDEVQLNDCLVFYGLVCGGDGKL